MWRHMWKSTLVGEEKPAAGINASSSGKCQQIDFSGIAARSLSPYGITRPQWVYDIQTVKFIETAHHAGQEPYYSQYLSEY